ncbi:hypothetical protein U472_11155 [Orenia metallireducens]|uniref:Sporulation-control protein n=1 Tax=Orenia metallireducens TaxID=1413210 RepID=A0A1C0A8J9_9FIRM|nr:sporulation protein [Orenia metallireducens]OCL26541.1 hypothetical protein U472_11155 [Orenia metallireducens]
MGLFKKMMASVGIGATKIDTVLDSENLVAGAEVTGHFEIKGGNVEQNIDKIYINVMTKYEKTVEDEEGEESSYRTDYNLQVIDVPVEKVVEPGDELSIPFSFVLDAQTPIPTEKFPVWLDTGLDIKNAIDPGDKDIIAVAPHPYMQIVLKALEKLGFVLTEINNQEADFKWKHPFVQELELKPQDGAFVNSLDELELLYNIVDGGLKLWIEVDRRANGLLGVFAEAMDLDESEVLLEIGEEDLEQGVDYVAEGIKNFIEQYI